MTRSSTIHHSPLGPLTLTSSEPGGLQALHFPGRAGTLQEHRHAPDGFTLSGLARSRAVDVKPERSRFRLGTACSAPHAVASRC
jgi:hypothetical protein